MSHGKLTTSLTVRVSKEMRKHFNTKAKKYGDPSAVHREIIEAFNDGRMTITPKPPMEKLYNEH